MTTSPADELRALVAVMDELGVTQYEKDGIAIRRPRPRVPSPSITQNERAAMKAATAKAMESILFASSEGFPIDDPPEGIR